MFARCFGLSLPAGALRFSLCSIARNRVDTAFLKKGERDHSFFRRHNPSTNRNAADHRLSRGPGQKGLEQASSLIRSARDVFMTGIGASWNAALAAGTLFYLGGHPAYTQEAGELLHFTAISRGSVIIAISRTGRSIEIVQLLDKAEASGATIIGITNSADSPLARESAVAIVVPTALDHAISVNAYSTLLIAASALASSATSGFASVADLYFAR